MWGLLIPVEFPSYSSSGSCLSTKWMFLQCCQIINAALLTSQAEQGGTSDIVCYDADSRGKLVTPRHGCHIHQRRVIIWPAATDSHSHCQHDPLKRMKGWESSRRLVSTTNNVIRPYNKYWCCCLSQGWWCNPEIHLASYSQIHPSSPLGVCLFLLTVLISCCWLLPGVWARLFLPRVLCQ